MSQELPSTNNPEKFHKVPFLRPFVEAVNRGVDWLLATAPRQIATFSVLALTLEAAGWYLIKNSAGGNIVTQTSEALGGAAAAATGICVMFSDILPAAIRYAVSRSGYMTETLSNSDSEG